MARMDGWVLEKRAQVPMASTSAPDYCVAGRCSFGHKQECRSSDGAGLGSYLKALGGKSTSLTAQKPKVRVVEFLD